MPDQQPSPWKDFSDLGALGIELVLSVFLFAWFGYLLDGRLGTSPILTVIGSVLGMAAGLWRAYRLIVKSSEKEDGG